MTRRFLESLRFYDRDHIPENKVFRLRKILRRSARFKGIECGSTAVRPLSMWVNALLAYHDVMVIVEPLKEKLKLAEETLANVSLLVSMVCRLDVPAVQAKKTFVAMQKDMFEAKEALESRIKEHRESIKKARAIENEIGVSCVAFATLIM